MMKKTWVAPVVEELGVEQTLGGSISRFFETDRNANNVFETPFGTVPGTRT